MYLTWKRMIVSLLLIGEEKVPFLPENETHDR